MLISLALMACLMSAQAKEGGHLVGLGFGRQNERNRFDLILANEMGNNWSLCCETLLSLPSDSRHINGTHERIRSILSVQYWPDKVFRGPMLSFGTSFSEKKGTGFRFSVGYACSIWKGLGAGLCYSSDIIKAPGQEEAEKGTSLKLFYRF